jgi:hypothetical protein
MNHQQIRHDRDVAAWAHDLGLTERQQIFSLRHRAKNLESSRFLSGALASVKQLVLKKQDRIIHTNRRLQQSLGIVGIRRARNLQTRNMDEIGFERLCVL